MFAISEYILEQGEWLFWLVKLGGTAILALLLLLVVARRFPRQVSGILTGLVIGMMAICLLNMFL